MRINYLPVAAYRALWVATGLLAVSGQAQAHHPMGGQVPRTFFEGLLSGIGHPIIGLDHLAFIIAVGLLSLSLSKPWRYWTPAAFIAATVAGAVTHLYSVNLPVAEILIALSLLAAGLMLFTRHELPSYSVPALAIVAGVLHGYAYGEAIIGAETTPLLAYFAGLSVIQYVIVLLAMWLAHVAIVKQFSLGGTTRWSGAAIGALGVAFLFGQVV
jgi:urease accessory protein